MNNQKGITLISIIIVVIVMIILAGVSISSTIGDDGVLDNSKNAVEKNDDSQSKEYIMESWSYVLARCENLYYQVDSNGKFTSEFVSDFNKAETIFNKYSSNYGVGTFNRIVIKLKDSKTNKVSGVAFKVNFRFPGTDKEEEKVFYIIDDKKVFNEEEFLQNYPKTETKNL